jgi:hypothetical protein
MTDRWGRSYNWPAMRKVVEQARTMSVAVQGEAGAAPPAPSVPHRRRGAR